MIQLNEAPPAENTDPIVQKKKNVVKEIDEEIEKKENPEKTEEDKEKETKAKIDELENAGEKLSAENKIKALTKEKAKKEDKAEEEGTKPNPEAVKVINEKISEEQEKIAKIPAPVEKEADLETAKEVKELKEQKVAATKAVEKEQATIDKVKASVDALVNPKEPEVKDKKAEEKVTIKGYMDKMAKEAEKEEEAKEKMEKMLEPKPNQVVDKVKEVEKEAGAEMESTIKAAVDKQKTDLETAVKAQETKAAKAKAKSNSAEPSEPTKSEDPGHFTKDEKWVIDMPHGAGESFIAKKVQTAIKK